MIKHFKLVIGAALILLAVIAFGMSDNVSVFGSEVDKSVYGGDAYTGIQNAAAETGSNVHQLGYTIRETYENSMIFIGLSLLVAGGVTILYDIAESSESKKKGK